MPRTILLVPLLPLLSSLAYAQDSIAPETHKSPAFFNSASRAAEELHAEEQQRIMGVVPAFNISDLPNAAPLNPQQKFQLAMKSASDPFTFVVAGLDAGLAQAKSESPGFGYGMQGYGKRFGASYMDSFDGAILGNALFPAMLHQDPRYFRSGTGTFGSRLKHAALSTVRCRDDTGKDDWNYSNLIGNLVAGAIANSYYEKIDRGPNLVFGRALTVTAEGALGAVFLEFWPDISRNVFHKRKVRD